MMTVSYYHKVVQEWLVAVLLHAGSLPLLVINILPVYNTLKAPLLILLLLLLLLLLLTSPIADGDR